MTNYELRAVRAHVIHHWSYFPFFINSFLGSKGIIKESTGRAREINRVTLLLWRLFSRTRPQQTLVFLLGPESKNTSL